MDQDNRPASLSFNEELLREYDVLVARERQEIKDIQANRTAEDVSEQPLTGELHRWTRQFTRGSKSDFVIWGHIHNDIHGRFPDGHWIRTSLIARVDGDIAVTLNSKYRLIGEEVKGSNNDD